MSAFMSYATVGVIQASGHSYPSKWGQGVEKANLETVTHVTQPSDTGQPHHSKHLVPRIFPHLCCEVRCGDGERHKDVFPVQNCVGVLQRYSLFQEQSCDLALNSVRIAGCYLQPATKQLKLDERMLVFPRGGLGRNCTASLVPGHILISSR